MYKLISNTNAKPIEINFDGTVKTYTTWDAAFEAWKAYRAKGVTTFIVHA